ncbi:nicotinamide-nucleotide adenylyltransferase [Halobium salinum]|uniref:Nicotinamide-nucleotide adenylyltransferase n=1 Tax=Halobium salinum TaxID=1364940 RepID=A0ABD5PHT6_9EURY|nr:nicotinamide-nucleotide adenylyltransferase [Halobium salinum]
MRGFYIGRFQPYHNGHQHMVEAISDEVDELVLGIGSAGDSHTPRNPFTAGERVMMLTKSLAEFDLTTYVVPIEDLDRNSVWVSHVQSMSPKFDVAYSNNPLVIQLFEEAGVEVRRSPMFRREVLEGTELRQRMIDDGDWENLVPEPVAGVIEEIGGVDRIQHVADSDSNGAGDDVADDELPAAAREMPDGTADPE